MNLKAVLTVSAIYLAVLGLGFMFAPPQIGNWRCAVDIWNDEPTGR